MYDAKWTIRSVTIYVRYDKNTIALQRLNGSGVEGINHPRRSIKIQSKPSLRVATYAAKNTGKPAV